MRSTLFFKQYLLKNPVRTTSVLRKHISRQIWLLCLTYFVAACRYFILLYSCVIIKINKNRYLFKVKRCVSPECDVFDDFLRYSLFMSILNFR